MSPLLSYKYVMVRGMNVSYNNIDTFIFLMNHIVFISVSEASRCWGGILSQCWAEIMSLQLSAAAAVG